MIWKFLGGAVIIVSAGVIALQAFKEDAQGSAYEVEAKNLAGTEKEIRMLKARLLYGKSIFHYLLAVADIAAALYLIFG